MVQLDKTQLRSTKIPRDTFSSIKRNSIILFLDSVHNTANIGNCFRLCDAFMLEKLVVTDSEALRPKKLKQFSKATEQWVPHEAVADKSQFLKTARAEGYQIIAGELCDHSQPLEQLRLTSRKLVLVLGSEVDGISVEVLALCDQVYHIPMQGMGNSLNVSNAAAILVWQTMQCYNNG
jgi:tRNA G18 (ribose-2'-O)-methylase SpoU